jgi:hypothetical protein
MKKYHKIQNKQGNDCTCIPNKPGFTLIFTHFINCWEKIVCIRGRKFFTESHLIPSYDNRTVFGRLSCMLVELVPQPQQLFQMIQLTHLYTHNVLNLKKSLVKQINIKLLFINSLIAVHRYI